MSIDAYIQAIRGLRALPDRAASGQLTGAAYCIEWQRLEAERDAAAQALTPEQLRAGYDRAQYWL